MYPLDKELRSPFVNAVLSGLALVPHGGNFAFLSDQEVASCGSEVISIASCCKTLARNVESTSITYFFHICSYKNNAEFCSHYLKDWPYQILVTFFNFLGTLPKVVVQLPIQFTTKIF